MSVIKTFLPFAFMAVILASMVAHWGDQSYFMICVLGLIGWLDYAELQYKVSKNAHLPID